jgi:prevent-host-death family protein
MGYIIFMDDPERGVSMFNVAEAKRCFSDLLGRVAYRRDTIVISRRGRPIAKLVPIDESPAQPTRLTEIKGWLEEDDPFFAGLEMIVSGRRRHAPRALRKRGKVDRP